MNVRIHRLGLGPIRTLPRSVAHRWPALAVATVAVVMPMSVALAQTINNDTLSIVPPSGVSTGLDVQGNGPGVAARFHNFFNAVGSGLEVRASDVGIVVSADKGSA